MKKVIKEIERLFFDNKQTIITKSFNKMTKSKKFPSEQVDVD